MNANNNPPLSSDVLAYEDLLKLFNCKQEAALCKRLEKNGIPWFNTGDGVWTTMYLVNVAGLKKLGYDFAPSQPQEEPIL